MAQQGLGPEQAHTHVGSLGPLLQGSGVGEVLGIRSVIDEGNGNLQQDHLNSKNCRHLHT